MATVLLTAAAAAMVRLQPRLWELLRRRMLQILWLYLILQPVRPTLMQACTPKCLHESVAATVAARYVRGPFNAMDSDSVSSHYNVQQVSVI